VRADGHRAHRQRRRGLVVELAALPGGQLAQRFDGDGELAAGAPLVPDPADHAVDQQDRVVPGLARRGERAGGGRPRVQPLPGLGRDDVRVEYSASWAAISAVAWARPTKLVSEAGKPCRLPGAPATTDRPTAVTLIRSGAAA
jgi:hypothetical protein